MVSYRCPYIATEIYYENKNPLLTVIEKGITEESIFFFRSPLIFNNYLLYVLKLLVA